MCTSGACSQSSAATERTAVAPGATELPGISVSRNRHEPSIRCAHETSRHGVNASVQVASGAPGGRPSAMYTRWITVNAFS